MKEWFKYRYGYVNLDAENIYLTKSGNWSETINLPEREVRPVVNMSALKTVFYLVVVTAGALYLVVNNLLNGSPGLLLLIGVPILLYSAYTYMVPELGAAFKIPKNKLMAVELDEQVGILHFLDGNGKESVHRLIGLDEKAIGLLTALKEDL